jgi:hypothetical protein
MPYTAAVRWLVLASLGVSLFTTTGATAGHPLRTGFLDPGAFQGPSAAEAVVRANAAGASLVRLFMTWNQVAPAAPDHPTDPDDPAYHWETIDQTVTAAVKGGLTPLVYISSPANWARGKAVGLPGTWPSPARLGQFSRAAATRYSGSFTPAGANVPLPRVRYWQVWNEPNAGREIAPQRVNGRPVVPPHYRQMVNAFATAVHGVNAGNQVVAGTLGPFGHDSKDIQVVAPLRFMSDLLCVSIQFPHRRTCSQRIHFDVWAHNPYTNGGPNAHARRSEDVSIGDLREMHTLLDAATRRGTVVSKKPPEFWVTEFSWDTRPPDPLGVPLALHARWVSEALYRMWTAGVSAVIWFRLQDDPLRQTPYQSGFYFANGKAKYSLEAYRFPFVAFRTGNGSVSVWGRTPPDKPGPVIVEGRRGGRWTTLARVSVGASGVFARRLSAPTTTTALRARLLAPSEISIPFSLTAPPGRKTTPFGCGGPIACPH